MSDQHRHAKKEAQTVTLGPLKITIAEDKNSYSSSSIGLGFESATDLAGETSLLKPVYSDFEKRPSGVDKLIFIVKKALAETGMTVSSGAPPAGHQEVTQGIGAGHPKTGVEDFASFHPGEKITITAEKGYYPDKFNAGSMVSETAGILQALAEALGNKPITAPTEALINYVHDAMEEHGLSFSDAVKEYKAAKKADTDAPNVALRIAVEHGIHPSDMFFPGDKRDEAIAAVTDAIQHAPKAIPDVVDQALKTYIPDSSAKIRSLFVEDVVEEVNKLHAKDSHHTGRA